METVFEDQEKKVFSCHADIIERIIELKQKGNFKRRRIITTEVSEDTSTSTEQPEKK